MAFIRIATPNDYDDYYKIKCGYADIFWNGFDKEPDYDGLKQAFLQRLIDRPSEIGSKVIYMIISDDNTACGYIMFTYNQDDVEIGFSILADYQGKGYGTMSVCEALKILKGRTVFARIRPDNMPSQRCFEKNGFVFKSQETEERYYPLDNSRHRYNRFEHSK